MTGTAAHVTPVVELDNRAIGSGDPGPITSHLKNLYFDIIRGRNAELCERIRVGEGDSAAVFAHVKATVAAKLRATDPGLLERSGEGEAG